MNARTLKKAVRNRT